MKTIGDRPVTIVAVTKYATLPQMREAYEAGLRDFGENKVQDALAKQAEWSTDTMPVRWHFIGRLQSNKVRKTLGHFHLIHSVDSLPLAEKLSEVNQSEGIRQPVLLQINMAELPERQGFMPSEAENALKSTLHLPGIEVKGLMAMAPLTEETARIRGVFSGLAAMRKNLSETCGIPLPELSMGMTKDYMHALDCGATIIRIGSLLFNS